MCKRILSGLLLAFAVHGLTITKPATADSKFHDADVKWQTVVNNGDLMPTAACQADAANCRTFNSYNQPSLNAKKRVVFRARSKGGKGGEPVHGVYTKDMSQAGPIVRVLDRDTEVPQPNNLSAVFIEPPSFPRIDSVTDMIATRGNHKPVWEYTLADGSDTKVGTTGIYTNPFGPLITGASKLGAVNEFAFFEVPEFPGTPFDVFPGSPAVTQGATIVFKGNYTVNQIGKTGVYYRDLKNQSLMGVAGGGEKAAVLIANNTHTLIPGTQTVFGSTAPPSAAKRQAVFAGFDNEENPSLGGIYLAQLKPYPISKQPMLKTLVSIGSQVPEEPKDTRFNRLGEGVSFDGRYVAFWGAWGDENKIVRLYCPKEGNKDRSAYCMSAASGSSQDAVGWYQDKSVPINQGLFLHDINTGETVRIARTVTDFSDFVYWNFSGRSPGAGEGEEGDEDGEFARWRSASFLAVSSQIKRSKDDTPYQVAFKARTGALDTNNTYQNPVDGIYLKNRSENSPYVTLIQTGMDGTAFDPKAVFVDEETGVSVVLPVTEMGLERDGFRNGRLAINASMGTEDAGWAGIYLGEFR